MTQDNTDPNEPSHVLDQIERAKQEWEATVDSLPQLICLLNNQGRILRANRTVESWDLSPVQVVKGQALHQLFHSRCDDPGCYFETHWPRMWDRVANYQTDEFEIQDRLLKRYLRFQIRPVTTDTRRRDKLDDIFAAVIVEDITVEKLISLALSDAQLQIRTLFENTPYGIALTTFKGTFLAANRALTVMTGYTEMELLRRNVTELYVDSGKRAILLKQLQESGVVRNFGVEALRKDGTSFFASLNVSRLTQAGEDVLLAVIEDVTEQVEAEEALRASEEQHRDLVEKVSDVIYAVDADGLITYLNPAVESLVGRPAEQLVGQPFAQFVHPEDLGRLQDNVRTLLSGGFPGPDEYQVLNALGETRWIRVNSQPVVDGGRVTGLQGVLTDVTERRRTAARLEQAAARAERDRLAQDLHDSVSQTLYSAGMIADATPLLLEQDPALGQQNLELLTTMIRGASAEMRSLLMELRPEALRGQTLGPLLEMSVAGARGRTQANVVLNVEGDRQLPEDITLALYHIAQEALNNVAKHAEASEVVVELTCNPKGAKLCVRDDGRGFDPHAIPAGHFGVGIMGERAHKIGARFEIDSKPGHGASVVVTWSEAGGGE